MSVFLVPAGVQHCPRAEGEVEALPIESRGIENTGNRGGERTWPLRER